MMRAFIETAAGSRQKVIYDDRTLERLHVSPVPEPYPFAYGFLLDFVGDDGECVDCFVVCDAALDEGVQLEVDVLGLVEQLEGDDQDHKVVTRPADDDSAECLQAVEQIRDFMAALARSRRDTDVRVGAFHPAEAALEYLASCS